MAKRTKVPMRLEAIEFALADGDAKPVWIQIAKASSAPDGMYRGHSSGPFKLDVSTFSEIISNWKADGSRPIPCDWEHQSEGDTAGPTPACGWLTDLRIEGDSLYGLAEWGDEARALIRSGAYRFCSPALRFGKKDRVSGKTIGASLSSLAITNRPFLQMQQIAAKDTPPADDVTVPAEATTLADIDFAALEHAEPQDLVALIRRLMSTVQGVDQPGGDQTAAVALLQQRETEIATLREKADGYDRAIGKAKKWKLRAQELDTQLVTLREQQAERDNAEAQADVDMVVMSRQVRGEEQRSALLAFRQANPSGFRSLYQETSPSVRAHSYLLRDVACGGRDSDIPTSGPSEANAPRKVKAKEIPDQQKLIAKFVAKGMSHEDAVVKSHDTMVAALKNAGAEYQLRSQ